MSEVCKRLVVLVLSLSLVGCNGFSLTMSSSSSSTATTNAKPYAVNLKFSVKPDRRDDFLSLVKENQRKTLDTEPAALQYIVGEDVDTANTFYIHEQFVGEEGFIAHRDTDHAADWAAFKNSDPFTKEGQPQFDFFYGDHEIEEVPIRSCFGVHVELCVKPDLVEEFLDVIQNNQKGSNNDEPLCLQYVYGESTTEKNKFVFHEEYTGEDGGKEGFNAHTKTPHFEKWELFTEKDPFSKPPVVNFFKSLD